MHKKKKKKPVRFDPFLHAPIHVLLTVLSWYIYINIPIDIGIKIQVTANAHFSLGNQIDDTKSFYPKSIIIFMYFSFHTQTYTPH